jgi:hypothetical protein
VDLSPPAIEEVEGATSGGEAASAVGGSQEAGETGGVELWRS